ncbi:unnamed protein product [Calypogeia fissa]
MGGKRRGGGGAVKVENSYEAQRNAMLEENRQRMLELGLLEDVSNLFPARTPPKAARLKRQKMNSSPDSSDPLRRSNRVSNLPVEPPPPPRRSSRLQGTPIVSYKDQLEDSDKKDRIDFMEGSKPEIYTEEDEKKLGSYEKEWELFKDGCDAKGRIYDSANGKTCHQCRQKTLGHRTSCSSCNALQGQFCGDCIFMRYGENVLETLQNKNWVCPICRGICNCSLCRPKRGWAPTGSCYRKALALGFKSVAHYLILTRRAESDS